MSTIVLHNEAVQALADPLHPKHRRVVAHLQGIVDRRRRGRDVAALVPTSVRVEAGWDRSRPGAAAVNRFRVRDHVLDGPSADLAASIVAAGLVASVADAHVGATVRNAPAEDFIVLTSDPLDMAKVCAPVPVRIVPI